MTATDFKSFLKSPEFSYMAELAREYVKQGKEVPSMRELFTQAQALMLGHAPQIVDVMAERVYQQHNV